MAEVNKHSVTVSDRKSTEVTGVGAILSFEEDFVALDTEGGRLIIEGEALRVESLSRESGKILIVGKINSLAYEKKRERRRLFGSVE